MISAAFSPCLPKKKKKKKNGYLDVAEELATHCNVKQNTVKLSTDLETIFQSKGMHLIPQTDGKKKRKTRTPRRLIAGVDFIDTDQVKFTNANSIGGAIINNYKGKQYCFVQNTKNQQVSYWKCRRHGNASSV